MAIVDDSRARRRTEDFLAHMREQVDQAFLVAKDAVIASALSRTPTMQEEYDILMEGDGHTSEVPMQGGSSADADDPQAPGRRRLVKEEETYLINVVPNPANQETVIEDGIWQFSIGNIALLLDSTTYTWFNAKPPTKKGEGGKVEEGGPSPSYWSNIENGSAGNLIAPRFERRGSGSSFYPLRPDFTRVEKEMYKPVRARRIFGLEILESVFVQTMTDQLTQR